MSNTIEVIQRRSSTRGYTEEPLTDSELNALLHAGLQAPTAANRQEIHFTVLKGGNPILAELEAEKNRLRNIVNPPHNFYYEAPTVILLSADSTYHWSDLDAGIAVENMALTAEELGLGSLIIGCIRDAIQGEKKAYFSNSLKLPENYEYKIAIAFGHKAVTKEPHTYDADAQITYLQ
ncbi:MAG: nitroreductase [Lachnospiraceae bacterium]|nr:nitroreductase [Lachnospiraceae bacterium]